MSDTLLVTGASGHLGRRVIHHLLQTLKVPAASIIATTRKPETLADLAALGVVVRQADFEDSASLVRAFEGAQRLLLISTDALDRPGRRIAQHHAAVAAALKAGVKHVVYTSMPKPEPGSPIPFAPDHYETEQALAASALSWTVLRNCWYMENLHMNLPQVLASGQWYTAAGEGKIAHISRDDCAHAAAVALASAATDKVIYNLTGAIACGTAEIAALASEVLGKPIAVVQVTPEALAQGMAAAGVPPFLVPLLVAFDVNTAAGNVGAVSDDFKKLTGCAPLSLREFLVANQAAFLS
ncbi:MAG: SDR family oxidoreductase [Rhodoferax sp.]|nr:SDR family oxidoreductase [Rhodoferax sp.]